MRKFSKLMTAVTASAILCACSANEGKADADQGADASSAADSVVTAQVEETAPLPALSTPDLAFVEACGNVKSVKEDDTILQFDAEGNLTSGLDRLKRDKDGRICQWGNDEYFVTWEDGRPKTLTMRESGGGKMVITYLYGEEGQVAKETILCDFPGDEPSEGTRSYTYDKDSFDAKGNWIVRSVTDSEGHTYLQKRAIAYY